MDQDVTYAAILYDDSIDCNGILVRLHSREAID